MLDINENMSNINGNKCNYSGFIGGGNQGGKCGFSTVTKINSCILNNKSVVDEKVINVNPISLSSVNTGSASTIPPIEGTSVFPYVRWFQTKSDMARICATWYTEDSYEDYTSYIIYSRTNFSSTNWYLYAGTWDNASAYGVDILVKYGSRYYRCIKAHDEPVIPTNTTYWTVKDMPDLSSIKYASAETGAYIPDNFDYIDEIRTAPGELYTTTKGEEYENMCVAMSTCISWRTVVNIGDTESTYYTWSPTGYWYNEPISFYRLNGTPVVSYDVNTNKISLSSSLSGRYLMEFYRSGYNPTIYGERIRNEFFLTSIPNLEYGYEGYYLINNQKLHRWKKNMSYTVGIQYLDNVNQSQMRSAIMSALSDINSAMSGFGISFNLVTNATSGDITIIVGSHEELFGVEASMDYWRNGTWSYDDYIDNEGYITHAEIRLANDICWHSTFYGTALEELLQCLGAGYDQTEYVQNTIHSEFSYLNKNEQINTYDNSILQILYSDLVSPNMNAAQVSVAVNPTIGATVVTNGQTLSFLEKNTTYNVTVYVVDRWGYLSHPQTLTITTPDSKRPDNWEWTTHIEKGASMPYSSDIGYYAVTAREWNDFTARINEFRRYKGLSDYSFTTAVRGNDFTAAAYNQAVNAIKDISGYGSYLSTVSRGDSVLASHFTLLRDELNAIP